MEPLGRVDPRKVGPYRLVGRLGGGGMGQVYLGRSRSGRPVAVKVVRPELAADPGFRRRFAREVDAARKVGGFHTAQVVDADPEADRPWLVTAYVPGPSLQAAVQEDGPLPAESVAALGAALVEGLAVIHDCGLVHRDLKPSNVILADDGPRVIDFGIVRALDATSHTVSRAVVGTPAFMSPEQARGHEVGPPSDVFSLGAVLMFAATGRGPFGNGPAHAIMYRIVHDAPDLNGLPKELRRLVADCLAKRPGRRPALTDVMHRLGGLHTSRTWRPPRAARSAAQAAVRPAAPQPAPDGPTAPKARALPGTGTGTATRRLPATGGFGLFDGADPAEPCPDCGLEEARRAEPPPGRLEGSWAALPTDLFCGRHDRFLPLANRTSVGRAGAVGAGVVLVYGLLWLTAALESSTPAIAAVAAVGLLAYLLPLRTHHVRAVGLAAALYVLTFAVTVLIGATDGDARRSLAGAAFFTAMALPAAHAAFGILSRTRGSEQIFARGPTNGMVALGAIPAAVALAAGLGWLLPPLLFDGSRGDLIRDTFLSLAVLALFMSLGVSGMAGLIDGMRRVARRTPRLPRPRRPRRVTWHATFSEVSRDRAATVVDRAADLARITAVRIADILRITLVTMARVAVNTLAELSRLLVVLVIEAVNLVAKAGVLLLRSIVAVTVAFAGSAARLLEYGLRAGASSLTALTLPTAALAGAAVLSVALAGHLLGYVRDGTMTDLGWFAVEAAAMFVLVTAAWTLSACQRVRLSLISAYRSANVAGPYLLLFTAIGGWLFTALSLLGAGHVRAGWATWTATVLLVAAFGWSRYRRRTSGHATRAEQSAG